MPNSDSHKRLHWRSHHRGTREADIMIGLFFDAHADGWSEEDRVWYTELLEEQDVDIMAWAIGSQPAPERFQGELMTKMQKLDYLPVVR